MTNYLPWVELYRPKVLDEIIGQEEIVKRLKAFTESKNMPNLIFSGPAGTGKTTCALALANDLYSGGRQNLLELNSSDARGIDVIRGQVKEFARSVPIGVPFRIILLDESDSMTQDAQHALRRMIELYASTTRFILSCNYSSKIIIPIQSRCAIFRFRPLSREDVEKMINRIAQKEGLDVEKEVIDALIRISEGDMRVAINALQSASLLNKKITIDEIYGVASHAQPKKVKEMVDLALMGNFIAARNALNEIFSDGLSGEDVLLMIYKDIVERQIPDRKKVLLIDRVGEYNFRMIEGANERIQLEALLAYIALLKE